MAYHRLVLLAVVPGVVRAQDDCLSQLGLMTRLTGEWARQPTDTRAHARARARTRTDARLLPRLSPQRNGSV